jgi:hypothetical protein
LGYESSDIFASCRGPPHSSDCVVPSDKSVISKCLSQMAHTCPCHSFSKWLDSTPFRAPLFPSARHSITP